MNARFSVFYRTVPNRFGMRPLFPLQGISLVLLDHDLHIVRLSDIRRIRADRITALNDAILDNGIIPNIHVI